MSRVLRYLCGLLVLGISPSQGADLSAAQVREIGARLLQDSDSDIDTAKVAEVRKAIAEGRIQIDPSKIADGLLASLHELSQGGSQS